MKSRCFAVMFAIMLTGCASASPYVGKPSSPTGAASTFSPYLAGGVKSQSSASQGPRIAVGTRYADERLNLPWFLNDAINAANGH